MESVYGESITKHAIEYSDFLKIKDRDAFLNSDDVKEVSSRILSKENIMFHPCDVSDQTVAHHDDKYNWSYAVVMHGVLKSGSKATVIVENYKPYITLKVPYGMDRNEYINEITELIRKEEMVADDTKTTYNNKYKTRIFEAGKELIKIRKSRCLKPFQYFSHLKYDYIDLVFDKLKTRRQCIAYFDYLNKRFETSDYTTYHCGTKYLNILARELDLTLGNWLELSDYEFAKHDDRYKTKYNFYVDYKNISRYSGDILSDPILAQPKLLECSWDIECSSYAGGLPQPEELRDKLFMIAMTFQYPHSTKPLASFVFTTLETPDDPIAKDSDFLKSTIVICNDEKEVILGCAHARKKLQPDIDCGYNVADFDWPWYMVRSWQLGILGKICQLIDITNKDLYGKFGYLKSKPQKIDSWINSEKNRNKQEDELKYKFYIGDKVSNVFKYEKIKLEADNNAVGHFPIFNGCIYYDAMITMKKLKPKAESNTLNYFLKKSNIRQKEDMPIHMLFKIYREMTHAIETNDDDKINEYLEGARQVADYCAYDSWLCHLLMKKQNVINDYRALANLTHTSIRDAIFRANSTKVQNIMARDCYLDKFAMSTRPINVVMTDIKYEGAYVLRPIKGGVTSKHTLEERIQKAKITSNEYADDSFSRGTFREITHTELTKADIEDKIDIFKAVVYEDNVDVVECNRITAVNTVKKALRRYEEKTGKRYSKAEMSIFRDFLMESTGRPISGLDFSSLYPSIMMCNNMSPEMLFVKKYYPCQEEYNEVKKYIEKNKKLRTIEFTYDGKKSKCITVCHERNSVKGCEDDPNVGIYVKILWRLFNQRKKMKFPMNLYDTLLEQLDKYNADIIVHNKIVNGEPLDEFNIKAFNRLNINNVESYLETAIELPQKTGYTMEEAFDILKNVSGIPHDVSREILRFKDGFLNSESAEFYYLYYKSQQLALKVMMNTIYGTTGDKRTRNYVLELAAGITAYGKLLLQNVESRCVRVLDCRIRYGDTDSVYISIPEKYFRELDRKYYCGKISKHEYWDGLITTTFEHIGKIRDDVNEWLISFTKTNILKMAYEEALFPSFWLSKKKYGGAEHKSVPNFEKIKLFIRGLEMIKRGSSNALKDVCSHIIDRFVSLDNLYTLIELTYNEIDNYYKTVSDTDYELFAKSARYKPVSEEKRKAGKGNKSVLECVDRMAELNHIIEPAERFKFIYAMTDTKYHDYRGRKSEMRAGEQMYEISVASAMGIKINIDRYMENEIIGQLGRIVIYHDEFHVEPLSDHKDDVKKAEEQMLGNAKSHLLQYARRYFKQYVDRNMLQKDIYKESIYMIRNECDEFSSLMFTEWKCAQLGMRGTFKRLCTYAEREGKKLCRELCKASYNTAFMNKYMHYLRRKYIAKDELYFEWLRSHAKEINELRKEFTDSIYSLMCEAEQEMIAIISKINDRIYNEYGLDDYFSKPVNTSDGINMKPRLDDVVGDDIDIDISDELLELQANYKIEEISMYLERLVAYYITQSKPEIMHSYIIAHYKKKYNYVDVETVEQRRAYIRETVKTLMANSEINSKFDTYKYF